LVGHHHLVPTRTVAPIRTPEPILPIAMIALDIDGTLVGDDLLIGGETRTAIRKARARGVIVSLITGRMVSSALRFARELDLVAPIVGYQGALIREMPAIDATRPGRLLIHTPMPADVARDVVVWARAQGLDPHVNHLERFIVRSDDPRADEYADFMGSRPHTEDDLIASIRHPVTKVMCAGEPPLPTMVAPLARIEFAGRADVTVSHPHFIEFVAPGVSKGRAVRWLARRLEVPLGAVMAIGDQWNDIEMLAEVGHGAAMPSAPIEVRAVARYVAPPLADQGVAQMIESLVLASSASVRAASQRLEAAAEAAAIQAAAEAAAIQAAAAEPAAAQPRHPTPA
jgi:Cof subfamily protein (haloacid dehalogenase superfamily)